MPACIFADHQSFMIGISGWGVRFWYTHCPVLIQLYWNRRPARQIRRMETRVY